jgi:hypothetical protein
MEVRCTQCGEINRLTTVEATEPQLCRRCGKRLAERDRTPSASVARERLLGDSPLSKLPLRKAGMPWPPEAVGCELPPPRPPRDLPTPAPIVRPTAAPFALEAIAPRPRRRRRRGSFLAGLFWFVGALGLAGLAAAQAVWQRPQLLDLHPALRPLAERGCAEIGCTVPVARAPAALAVLSSRLEPVEGVPGVSELRVQLRNGAAFAQPLPDLRLTLLDDAQRPVARRTLSPADYLHGAKPDLAAGATAEARVLLEAPQREASGFQVDLDPEPGLVPPFRSR